MKGSIADIFIKLYHGAMMATAIQNRIDGIILEDSEMADFSAQLTDAMILEFKKRFKLVDGEWVPK